MAKKLVTRIKDHNQQRQPAFLERKYQLMYEDKYSFFRATTHLFYEDIPLNSFLHKAPPVWICGDLHLENFGSYKGENRVAYFNINDFDECILGSPLLDIARLLTSLHVAANNLKIPLKTIHKLNDVFVDTYFKNLQEGYIKVLEKETVTGIMRKFLEMVKKRKRKAFIKKRTFNRNEKTYLTIDNIHTVEISAKEKASVIKAIKSWALKTSQTDFFEVRDLALRIAGTSSLGLKRYVVLVEGKGSPDSNYLLDIKEARPSCLCNFIHVKQPKWSSEAERVIEIQKRFISDPPALLHSINISGKKFVVKELQPTADRLYYKLFAKNSRKFESIIGSMACIYAWSNLRTSGRQGSGIADELISFAKNNAILKTRLKEYAFAYSKKIDGYYNEYCRAFNNGSFTINTK